MGLTPASDRNQQKGASREQRRMGVTQPDRPDRDDGRRTQAMQSDGWA
jgi:hypothetical protein